MTDTSNFKAPHITEGTPDKFFQHNEALDTLDAALAEASPFAPDNVQNLDANGVLTGLTFGYLGGRIRNGSAIVTTARGTVVLTASATNHVEMTAAGVVSVNQTGFTAGRIPLHEVTTDTTDMTAITDKRAWFDISHGRKKFNAQTGTAYTLALSDAENTEVSMDNVAANNLTVPPVSSVPFTAGDEVDISQEGAGQTTLVAGTGVTINSPASLVLSGQYAKVKLVYKGADIWQANGDLAP